MKLSLFNQRISIHRPNLLLMNIETFNEILQRRWVDPFPQTLAPVEDATISGTGVMFCRYCEINKISLMRFEMKDGLPFYTPLLTIDINQ